MNKPTIFAFNHKGYLSHFKLVKKIVHVHQNLFILVLDFTLGGRIVLSTAHEEQIKKQKMVNDIFLPSVNNSCFLNQQLYFSNSVKFISKQVEFISCVS